MKIRSGFVSNSSSSSFIVFGVKLSVDEYTELLNEKYDVTITKDDIIDCDCSKYSLERHFTSLAGTDALELIYSFDGSNIYLGVGSSLDDYNGLETEFSTDELDDVTQKLKSLDLKPKLFGDSYY